MSVVDGTPLSQRKSYSQTGRHPRRSGTCPLEPVRTGLPFFLPEGYIPRARGLIFGCCRLRLGADNERKARPKPDQRQELILEAF